MNTNTDLIPPDAEKIILANRDKSDFRVKQLINHARQNYNAVRDRKETTGFLFVTREQVKVWQEHLLGRRSTIS